MSDQTNCTNTDNSMDHCDALSCYVSRKRIKLTPSKNRNARSLTEKIQTQSLSNSWKFIDKNETMIAELSGGKLTLWQFLLELLMSDDYSTLIKWTDRNIGEFILIQAEEVAKLWGIRKDRNHRMNYDKLSRALRYYYQKNIIKKVHGHKFVYRFVSLVPETMTSPCSSQKAIVSGHVELSQHNTPLISASDSETASMDNGNQRTNTSRIQPPMTNILRMGTKNNKSTDFNSTLSALFQAALLSLSGSNSEIPPALFPNNHNSSEQRSCSPNNDTDRTNSRMFDIANQNPPSHPHDCVCKPEMLIPPTSTGMFFPSSSGTGTSLHVPSFDRQSMLHFSRHSINMQRLSQEILLNATSKSRFNPCISNPLLTPADDAMESQNHNFWLNQFAQDLYKSTANTNNSTRPPNANQSAPEERDSPEILIKTEKNVESAPINQTEESNSLTILFQKFVKDLENKTTTSDASQRSHQNYSHSDLANLIKSQLSSQSSFVWMPVPVNFAEEIMDFCVRSLSNRESS